MISIFRWHRPPSEWTGYGPTPLLPFNHTVESLTRDVYVKPLHSHNDYWRQQPLFDALGAGCQSVESDVWVFPKERDLERTQGSHTEKLHFKSDEVYVGHNEAFLKPINTLYNLYLRPIESFLNWANPQVDGTATAAHSVFFNEPEKPLYFWMDFKTDPDTTYDVIKPLFKDLMKRGFLAHYDVEQDKYVPGPLVVTITGNLPVEKVKAEKKVYLFLDGALEMFARDTPHVDLQQIAKYSRVASSSVRAILGDEALRTDYTEEQRDTIAKTMAKAHEYGLKTRVWGDITWPTWLVERHVRDMFEGGSDFLNVDDVRGYGII